MHLLIVDDETLARDRLAQLVSDVEPDARTSQAATVAAAEAVMAGASDPVSLVLLDIEMPGETGLDWLQRLSQASQPPAVIMTTAWAEYALPAIQQGADGYLLKPVKSADLAKALAQARKKNRLQGTQVVRVPLNTDGTGGYVPLDNIVYCVADARWVRVIVDEEAQEQVSDRALKDWEAEFGHVLVRTHRSYLVHHNAVVAVRREDGQTVVDTIAGDTLPVSRRHVTALRQRLAEIGR